MVEVMTYVEVDAAEFDDDEIRAEVIARVKKAAGDTDTRSFEDLVLDWLLGSDHGAQHRAKQYHLWHSQRGTIAPSVMP